jgi:murein DD-endopeptidase MepM/ murein hydrolase activator NlpD
MPLTNPPTAIRNKNYLNVKNNKTNPWKDKNGSFAESDSRGHAIFQSAAYGVAAGIKTLRTYYQRHELRTIAQILARWAPATGTIGDLPGAPKNSPKEYSEFVSGRMGIGPNEQLRTFHPAGGIGDVSQLRVLFEAMATYEIGLTALEGKDFRVPDKEWRDGLEIVEPGIVEEGPDAPLLGSEASPETTSSWKIRGSVGRPPAENRPADVKLVHAALRQVGMILQVPAYDPGALPNAANPASANSFIRAIEAFQGRFFAKPDGIVDVGGRTWQEILNALSCDGTSPAAAPLPNPTAPGTEFFPFSAVPEPDWVSGGREFAAKREGGKRAHAGCDLKAPVGTPIYAVKDGIVVRKPSLFYAGTYAIEIDHGDFLIRYGEVDPVTYVTKGDHVVAGQLIGRVGDLEGSTNSMLHLEMYDKSAEGPLTVGSGESKFAPDGRPFYRRKDLIDPTAKLNAWSLNLPKAIESLAKSPATKAAPQKTSSGVITTGFCIVLKRTEQQSRGVSKRTVGTYACYWNGEAIPDLSGQMAECPGPGNNTAAKGGKYDLRIKAGTYRIANHLGSKYRTDYEKGQRRPGLWVADTDERSAILIHPGNGFLSSVGCINPTTNLAKGSEDIDYADSTKRVIAIIKAMRDRLPAWRNEYAAVIPDAFLVIQGEPT